MATKQIHFFADKDDLEEILQDIENSNKLEYADAGLFDSVDSGIYNSHTDISGLGRVGSGDWNQNKFYIIYLLGDDINKRPVPLKSGGMRYAVYQDTNPRTVILKPGGIFEDGVLVAGSIGTISSLPISVQLFNDYSKRIKKAFTKVGSFYVGRNAKRKLDQGWRLVTNVKSPKEYDLKP